MRNIENMTFHKNIIIKSSFTPKVCTTDGVLHTEFKEIKSQ